MMVLYFSNKIRVFFYYNVINYFINNYISHEYSIKIKKYFFLNCESFIQPAQINYSFIFAYIQIKIIKTYIYIYIFIYLFIKRSF